MSRVFTISLRIDNEYIVASNTSSRSDHTQNTSTTLSDAHTPPPALVPHNLHSIITSTTQTVYALSQDNSELTVPFPQS